MRPDVIVAGHVCLDLLPSLSRLPRARPGALEAIGPLDARPGGCVGNTGPTLAALGTPVRLAGWIGDDAAGRLLVDALSAQRDVDLTDIVVSPELSTSYTIVLDAPEADRSFWHCAGANEDFDPARIDLTSARLLHLGYPALLGRVADDGIEPVVQLFARARAAGITTSLDLAAIDPDSPAAALDWCDLLLRLLPEVDVFSPSIDDLVGIMPGADTTDDGVRAAAQWAVEQGCAVALVTAGSRGAHLTTADAPRMAAAGAALGGLVGWAGCGAWVSAAPVTAVRHTNGAGDAATAGLLHAIVHGASPLDAAAAAAAAGAARVEGRVR